MDRHSFNRTKRCVLTATAVLTLNSLTLAASPHSPRGPNQSGVPIAPPNCLSGDQVGSSNPGVHPPCSRPYGLTYGQWSARWWQWIMSFPPGTNPNFQGLSGPETVDCAAGQAGPVWFLAGNFGGTAQRTCNIPTGVSLLFPIKTTIFGDGWADCIGAGSPPNPDPFNLPLCAASYWPNYPWGPEVHNWSDLTAMVNGFFNPAGPIVAEIDGHSLTNLGSYRAEAPVFSYTVTTDNVNSLLTGLTYGAGTYSPAGAGGVWIMLTPLPPGLHTVHFASGDGWLDVTYHLTVGHK